MPITEHRSSERGLYDKLQQPEHAKSRELLELLLSDPKKTYDEIAKTLNDSNIWNWAALGTVRPQTLTRYRQRKAREEARSRAIELVESEAPAVIEAATKNPTGTFARYLRKAMTELMVTSELEHLNLVDLSKETARHAQIEQVDRRIEIEQEKLKLEEKRIALQQQAAMVEKDKLGIAISVWEAVLVWCAKNEIAIADVLTRRGEEVTGFIEEKMSAE